MDRGEIGVSEVIGTILIVSLVVVLGIVVAGLIMGLIPGLQPKSAFIAPRVEILDVSGTEVISLFSRAGDRGKLASGGAGEYSLAVYLDSPSGTQKATPDPGVGTWFPGQTLYLYHSSTGLRLTDNLSRMQNPDPMPAGRSLLRIVDENAQLLVLEQGMSLAGGGTVTPTVSPTCTLGTAWRIWNQDTVTHTYLLKVEPGGPVLSTGTVPRKTQLFVWYSIPPPYQANLTTVDNSRSEVRGAGQPVCQFSPYQVSFPGGSTQARLQLNAHP